MRRSVVLCAGLLGISSCARDLQPRVEEIDALHPVTEDPLLRPGAPPVYPTSAALHSREKGGSFKNDESTHWIHRRVSLEATQTIEQALDPEAPGIIFLAADWTGEAPPEIIIRRGDEILARGAPAGSQREAGKVIARAIISATGPVVVTLSNSGSGKLEVVLHIGALSSRPNP